jgi:hypothetical protein
MVFSRTGFYLKLAAEVAELPPPKYKKAGIFRPISH